MILRVKIFVGVMLLAAACAARWAIGFPSEHWLRFSFLLAAVLLSSGLKVAMPKRDGTMSVNFPFILLGAVELSPGQAIVIAALSVAVQCRINVVKSFTFVQIAFNIANVMMATAVACLCTQWTTRLHSELAPALAIAALAYFFANTVPVAFVIGWSSGQTPYHLWRREFPWYLPFYLVGAALAAVAHLISLRFGWMTSLMLVPVIYTIYRAYKAQMATIADRQQHLEETEALHLRTIEGLAMAIEAKDQNTHDHLLRVRLYVSEIGKSFGLSELAMKALVTASFLHDIGKLAVPEHILNKPGKLTPEEFEKIKIHPVVGAEILERVRFPYPVVPIVRSHHEAWDGSGYPDGLKGEEIPLGARILTAVDCFDALASDRPYRNAMPLQQAMEFLKRNAGTQFDPRVVEILEQRYIELEEKARQQGEALAPLKTDISVWRGAAPGAGFQQDGRETIDQQSARASGNSDGVRPLSPSSAMNLIAMASQEAQAIFEMSQLPGGSLSHGEIVSMMSSRLRRLVAFDCFALYLVDDEALSLHSIDGEGARCFSPTASIPLGAGLSGWVAQGGKTIINGNPQVEPNYRPDADSLSELSSALSLPLLHISGNIFGVLTLYSFRPDAFSNDHLRIVKAIELKFSLSFQNTIRSRPPGEDAALDGLTQLPTMRRFFHLLEAEVNKANRLDQRFSLVVCNLQTHTSTGGQQAQPIQDALLRQVAQAFVRDCRSYDLVARLGLDQLVFLLPGTDDTSCARQLVSIDASVQAAFHALELDGAVATSLGTAFYPRDAATTEELLGLAERRMYRQMQSQDDLAGRLQHAAATGMAAVA